MENIKVTSIIALNNTAHNACKIKKIEVFDNCNKSTKRDYHLHLFFIVTKKVVLLTSRLTAG